MIAWMLYAALVATLIAAGAFAVERLMASAGRPRRFVWMTALALAVAIPLAGRTPAPTAPAVQEATSAVSSLVNGAPADSWSALPGLPVPERVKPDRIAALAWGAASLTALFVLGCVLLAVAWRRHRWDRRRVAGTQVHVSRRFGPTLVGVAKPKVVVPAWVLELEPVARDAIIRHEVEHARARDHLALLCGGLVTALFPWSPAIWWMCRRLRTAVELDCDDRVLASGIGVADYGDVLLEAGARSRRWWGFAPAMGHPESLLERRLKTMSEKRRRLSAGRAVALAGVAAGALVAACDIPVPTELGDAIEEVTAVEAHENRDGSPSDATGGSNLAKWFGSDPAPLVFVDGVRVGRYEDLPEPVRRWSESGLQEDGLVDRVEVMQGGAASELWGEEGAHGAIRIFMSSGPVEESDVEPPGDEPAEPNPGDGSHRAAEGVENLWGDKFSRMAGPEPLPLIVIDGVVIPPGTIDGWGDLVLKAGDIESFEIVKGAAGMRIYGEDAAHGVIQIFTKKRSAEQN